MQDSRQFESLGLGPIEQVAYAVHDMDRALARYQPIYGAFDVYDAPNPGCTYRGNEAAFPVRIGTNNDGPIEIELLQPLGGPSVLTEHLENHGEGLHHVRFRCQEIDAKSISPPIRIRKRSISRRISCAAWPGTSYHTCNMRKPCEPNSLLSARPCSRSRVVSIRRKRSGSRSVRAQGCGSPAALPRRRARGRP